MMGHAEQMDASAYWRNYEVKASWEKPDTVLQGTVEALRETRSLPSESWKPRLIIRRHPDAVLVTVDAYQERLLAELVLHKPMVGDKIRITYLGPDKRSPAGRDPVKRFRVEVWPQNPQPPVDGTESPPDPENAPEAGL